MKTNKQTFGHSFPAGRFPAHGVLGLALLAELSFACVGSVSSTGGAGDSAGGGSTGGDPGTGNRAGTDVIPDVIPPPGFDPGFVCTGAAAPAATVLRRLSRDQLVATLDEFMSQLSASERTAAIAGVQSRLDLMPEDAGMYKAYDTNVVSAHVTSLFGVAFDLGNLLAGNAGYAAGLTKVCGAGGALTDDVCLTKFADYYARKVLRRPATTTERDDYKAFYKAQGLASLISRLLSNPRLYYSTDNEGEKVSGTDGTDAAYKLTKYELLSKLTYVFWNRPPSDELYDAIKDLDPAAAGTSEQILTQVLSSPLAKNGIRGFFGEWLKLDRIPVLKGSTRTAFKNLATGLNIDAATTDHRGDMIKEVLDMGEHYTFNKGNVADLISSNVSFARTPALAQIYGAPVWDGSASNLVSFPGEAPRTGLFTRGAMLLSGNEYSRPVIRGKAVRMAILCEEIPEPPADVVAKFVTLTPDVNKTGRQILTEAMAIEPRCEGCHAPMNPLGYLLEGYDPVGRYRTEEMKFDAVSGAGAGMLPVDTKAVAGLYDGDTEMLSGAADLSDRVAKGGRAQLCLAGNFFRFAIARDQDATGHTDDCALEAMWKWAFAADGSLLDMAKEATRGLAFRVRLGPQ